MEGVSKRKVGRCRVNCRLSSCEFFGCRLASGTKCICRRIYRPVLLEQSALSDSVTVNLIKVDQVGLTITAQFSLSNMEMCESASDAWPRV
jgi:hypothetical protein